MADAEHVCVYCHSRFIENNGLDDIGCFVILEKEEFACVPMNELEFVEVLEIGAESYLHGVRIIDESCGEDIYLPVEVVRC